VGQVHAPRADRSKRGATKVTLARNARKRADIGRVLFNRAARVREQRSKRRVREHFSRRHPTGEVDAGKRIQKFVRSGAQGCLRRRRAGNRRGGGKISRPPGLGRACITPRRTMTQVEVFANPVARARPSYPFVVMLQADVARGGRERAVAPMAPRTAFPAIGATPYSPRSTTSSASSVAHTAGRPTPARAIHSAMA